jgi:iron complex outermembrane receptor protein
MMRIVETIALALAAGVVLPALARAEVVEAAAPEDEQVVEVRPAHTPEGEAALRDPTGASTRVDPRSVPGAQARLSDLLQASPGAGVRRAGAPGGREELLVRGANGQQVLVVLDGVPLNSARGGAFDLSTLPAAYVGQLELLRGPASAQYGGGALGGVLRVVTPTAAQGTQWSGGLRLGQLEAAGGDAALSHGAERFELLALVGGSRAAGRFGFQDVHGDDRLRENADHAEAHGLARARLRLGRGASLVALAEGFGLERGEPGFEQFENTAARSTRRRAQVALSGDAGRALHPALRLESAVWARSERVAYADPEPKRAGAARRYITDERALGGRLATTFAGDAAHAPSVVVDVRHDAARTRLHGGLFGDGLDGRRLGLALTALEQWAVLPGRLHLSGALRLDDDDRRAPVLVPRAGALALLPFGDLSLRANIGRAFRDPSFDELYFESPGVRGQPGLQPEDGWTWDMGLGLARRDWSLELTAFEQRFERLILFVPVQALQIEARDDYAARARGVEAAGSARAGPVSAQAQWTLLDARFAHAPHAPLPYRPTQRFGARVALHAQAAQLWASADARGEVTTDVYGHARLPAQRLFGLGVQGPLPGGLLVGAEINNVTNVQDAVDAVQQPLPGRLWTLYLRKE